MISDRSIGVGAQVTLAIRVPVTRSIRLGAHGPLAIRVPVLRRAGLLLVLAALLALWFGFLELRGLYFPDEGRYAEIPREMLASGDWVTPRLNGIPYFEKPPLQYWATAAVFAVAGEDEWTTRLWPAFAGFLAVIAVLVTTRTLVSRRAGWVAAAVMGSCWGYFLGSQFVTLDMTLTAFMTAALCCFLLAQHDRAAESRRRRFMLLAWASCALAVLTKGIVGIALPMLSLAAYVALVRDVTVLRRLHLVPGIAIFALIVLPWFVLVEGRNPGFAHFFLIEEHVLRYMQPGHRRVGPWWYFVPVAVAFLMPWLPAMVAALRRPAPARLDAFDGQRFAWCFASAVFVFFSLSSSKLPAYIMPAIGAVAIAVAEPLARRLASTLRITAMTLFTCGVACAVFAIPAISLVKVAAVRDELAGAAFWIYACAAVGIAGGPLALSLLRRRRPMRALGAVVVTSMLACQLAGVLAYRVDAYFSSERLIEALIGGEMAGPFRPGAPFYSVDMFDHTVPFYLGRTVILVHDKNELAPGIASAPVNYLPEIEDFERQWLADVEAYAIMGKATYDELAASGLPMKVVESDGRRVVVSRR